MSFSESIPRQASSGSGTTDLRSRKIMSVIKLNVVKNNVWPPDSLEKFINNIYANNIDLSTSAREALERFTATENIDLKLSYQSLAKEYRPRLVCKYLEQVWNCFLEIEMYNPIKIKKYKDWLRKISKGSTNLAEMVDEHPSTDLLLPEGLGNIDSLIQAVLDCYGNEITKNQYMAIDPLLRRSLKTIPISMMLNELSNLTKIELSTPPKHYWEKELGIKVPVKHGEDGSLVREQIAVRVIKKITLATFKEPHHDIVATLVNTLIGTEKFTADTVSKSPL